MMAVIDVIICMVEFCVVFLNRVCINNIYESVGKYRMNTLWPSDTIWRQKYGSTGAHLMACDLAAPSIVVLNQCWIIIRGVRRHSPENNSKVFYAFSESDIILNIPITFSRYQWIKGILCYMICVIQVPGSERLNRLHDPLHRLWYNTFHYSKGLCCFIIYTLFVYPWYCYARYARCIHVDCNSNRVFGKVHV